MAVMALMEVGLLMAVEREAWLSMLLRRMMGTVM
jgi:hypothetical protein